MDTLKANSLIFSYFEAWDKSLMCYKKGDTFFASIWLTEFVALSERADSALFLLNWGCAKHPVGDISLFLSQQQGVTQPISSWTNAGEESFQPDIWAVVWLLTIH